MIIKINQEKAAALLYSRGRPVEEKELGLTWRKWKQGLCGELQIEVEGPKLTFFLVYDEEGKTCKAIPSTRENERVWWETPSRHPAPSSLTEQEIREVFGL